MKIIEVLDQAIRAKHWHYDTNEEQFMDGDRALSWKDVINLVPDLTPADIARYENSEQDRIRGGSTGLA